MARRVLGLVAFLLVAAAPGCSTTQPTAKPAQNIQVTFSANAPRVLLFEVWNASLVTVTTSPDGSKDQTVQDLGLWCDIADSPDQQQRLSAVYPFRFSVEIDRIRAGTSTIERLSDATYASSYGSVTAYDESAPETPTKWPVDWVQNLSDPGDPDTTVVLSLESGRRISTASRDFVESAKIEGHCQTDGTILPGPYGSRCPCGVRPAGGPLGEASVAGNPSSFPVELNAGDTVIVKARKDSNPVTTSLWTNAPPTFGSQIFLEGKDVSSSLVGNTFSPQYSQDGISYAFTLR